MDREPRARRETKGIIREFSLAAALLIGLAWLSSFVWFLGGCLALPILAWVGGRFISHRIAAAEVWLYDGTSVELRRYRTLKRAACFLVAGAVSAGGLLKVAIDTWPGWARGSGVMASVLVVAFLGSTCLLLAFAGWRDFGGAGLLLPSSPVSHDALGTAAISVVGMRELPGNRYVMVGTVLDPFGPDDLLLAPLADVAIPLRVLDAVEVDRPLFLTEAAFDHLHGTASAPGVPVGAQASLRLALHPKWTSPREEILACKTLHTPREGWVE